MAGVENTEEIKKDYEKKVRSFDGDIQLTRKKIDEAILEYTEEKIKTQNLDLAFKRIVNTLLKNNGEKGYFIDENMQQLFKELSINDKKQRSKHLTPLSSGGITNKSSKPRTLIGSSFEDSRLSLKTFKGQVVNENIIAKIDGLEKELIKKKYELQIVRKDLYNNLEREQKDKLIQDLQ